MNQDFVLDHPLHVVRVEIAQAHCLYTLVLRNVTQRLQVLCILILNPGVPFVRSVQLPSGKNSRWRWVPGKTYELPVKLQKIDPRDL